MKFTYDSYRKLIAMLRKKNYDLATYHDWMDKDKCVILRHDVDNDLQKAVMLADIEKDLGVNSTYFVLLTSDFYNVFSKESKKKLKELFSRGMEIGLHFDEARYPEALGKPEAVIEKIVYERDILSLAIDAPVTTVSMHRPSREILDADLQIPQMINSYGKTFFHDFKYLSDSRRFWREPVEEIIDNEQYERLHILTHPFWYFDQEKTMEETVKKFINSANRQRYGWMESNITDLRAIMKWEEVQ